MTIQVEFDGGCISYEGKGTGAIPVLKCLIDNGHNIAFSTDRIGDRLEEAKKWFKYNKITPLCENLNTGYVQMTINPKDVCAHLTKGYKATNKPFTDWVAITGLLWIKGIITHEQKEYCENQIREELFK